MTHRNSITKYLAQVVAIDSQYEFVKDERRPMIDAPLYELYVAVLKSYVSDRALSVLNGVSPRRHPDRGRSVVGLQNSRTIHFCDCYSCAHRELRNSSESETRLQMS